MQMTERGAEGFVFNNTVRQIEEEKGVGDLGTSDSTSSADEVEEADELGADLVADHGG